MVLVFISFFKWSNEQLNIWNYVNFILNFGIQDCQSFIFLSAIGRNMQKIGLILFAIE